MRRIPIAPTLMTLGNAFCGFVALGYVAKAMSAPQEFGRLIGYAGWFILFGMVFDALDGKVARMTRMTSDFGEELDSLSDVITFGVAPALLVKVIAMQQDFLPKVGWVTSALYVLCAALRLARFNVETSQEEEAHLYFKGLPSPAAAGVIAGMTIMYYELRGDAGKDEQLRFLARALEPLMSILLYIIPFVAVLLAVLMVSNVRYVHVLNRLFCKRQPMHYLVTLILLASLFVLAKPFSVPLFFGLYVLSGIVGWMKDAIFAPAGRHEPAAEGDGE